MKTTASDVLIDSIHDWGVDVGFLDCQGMGSTESRTCFGRNTLKCPIRTSHSASAFGLLSIASLRRPFQ